MSLLFIPRSLCMYITEISSQFKTCNVIITMVWNHCIHALYTLYIVNHCSLYIYFSICVTQQCKSTLINIIIISISWCIQGINKTSSTSYHNHCRYKHTTVYTIVLDHTFQCIKIMECSSSCIIIVCMHHVIKVSIKYHHNQKVSTCMLHLFIQLYFIYYNHPQSVTCIFITEFAS